MGFITLENIMHNMNKEAKHELNDLLYTLSHAVDAHNNRDANEFDRQIGKVIKCWESFIETHPMDLTPFEAIRYAQIKEK